MVGDDKDSVEAPPVEAAEQPSRWASLRRRVKASGAQLEERYDSARARREESTPIDVAFRVIEADRQYAGGLISGGMAFKIFVWLVPFAFVIVFTVGLLGEAFDPQDPVDVARHLGMTGLVASAVNASIDASTLQRILTLALGLYAVLYTTWNLVRATRVVHGLAWGIELPRLTRPWCPVLWTAGGALAYVLGGAATSRLSDAIDPIAEILVRVLLLGVVILTWIGVSWWLPRAEGTTWRSLVPGAVLVGVGTEVLQFLTVYFFSRYIESKTDTYGSIGASIAILLWAYLLGRLVVTSAFLNAARWRSALEHPEGQAVEQ